MGSHPLNLAVRFLLEISALVAMAAWGWRQGDSATPFLLGLGIPLIAAIMWGTFAVPDDPSRSGRAPVPVPGIVRLALELAFFAFGAWALYDIGHTTWGVVMGVLVVIHYVVSCDRIQWLLKR
ncbi:MAG: YrdB family protein [Candidatus Hermodarchaeia archaeon]|jgi:hypothetical protein